jgi:hypothetical protein
VTGTTTQRLTLQEAIESLTGWEEIAIEQAAGYTIEKMNDEDNPRSILLARSVAAVVKSREDDVKYAEAYRAVMGMKQSEVLGFFAEAEEEPVEHDPITEPGKGDSPDVNGLRSSQRSASSQDNPLTSTPA